MFPKPGVYKSVPQNRSKSQQTMVLHSRPGRPVQLSCCRCQKTILGCVPIFYHIFPIKSASGKMRTRVFPNSRILYTRVFPKTRNFPHVQTTFPLHKMQTEHTKRGQTESAVGSTTGPLRGWCDSNVGGRMAPLRCGWAAVWRRGNR